MQFRHDINGLRAIAAVAIVAFHISPTRFSGGFVGVDIFYVISGYLITSIIWRDVSAKSFSFAAFYARRARRLFPALLVMVLAVYAASWWFMLPFELEELGRAMVSSVLYVSNFYFYTKAGYFDSEDQFSPLLHTWSLSIEEQFYLLLPIALILLVRLGRMPVLFALVAAAVASFAACMVAMQVNVSAAFYFSPFRFWELLLGSIVALWQPVFKARTSEAIALVGLALMAGSILFFDKILPFPGPMALLPAAGAALVIASGIGKETLVVRPLALMPVQWLGKISYSLYLWHWPVVVFYNVAVNDRPEILEQIMLMAVSIVLGGLSYYLVEAPSQRLMARWSPGRLGLAALAMSATLTAAAVPLVVTGGFASRFSEQVEEVASYLDYEPLVSNRVGQCFITSESTVADFDTANCLALSTAKPDYLLLGDSHAAHFYPGLLSQLPEVRMSQLNASGCMPVLHPTGETRCIDLMKMAFETVIPNSHFDKVIISALWLESDVESLVESVEYLVSIGQDVVVLGPVVTYTTSLPRLLAVSLADDKDLIVTEDENYDEIEATDRAMAAALEGTGATYISVLDLICPDKNCTTMVGDVPIQFDYGHLTVEGSEYLIRLMRPALLR